jgi:hypothetical protein
VHTFHVNYDEAMRASAVALLFALTVHAADRVTATGSVVDESTRQPIENATVMVYSAAVKTGYDLFCPTCYLDCGKRAATDEKGAFDIPGLSPDLVFNLLVIREGYGEAFIRKLDPAPGPAPPVALKKRLSPEDPLQVVRGRIVDAKGEPVRDALITQQGIIFERGRSFGDQGWIDLAAVSNRAGEFEMAYGKPAKAMILEVATRGMAPKLVSLPTRAERHTVTVTDGATIRGRLVHDGKPVANAQFVLSTHSRYSGSVFQDVRIGTNEKGEFTITNTPPGRVWDLYPSMDSLAPKGLAARVTFVATKDDGQKIDVGDIPANPGHALRGRIVIADGSPIPAGMRVSLFADRIPDRQSLALPPDGSFEFKGLANGVYTLSPAVKGYERRDPEQQIELLIEGDRKEFNVTLYPPNPPAR